MERIKIIFFYSSVGFGGIVRNLKLIVENLDLERFEPIVISLSNGGDEQAKLKLGGERAVKEFQITDQGKLNCKIIGQIAAIVEQEKAFILSCHGYKADIYGVVASKKVTSQLKLVTIAHGWPKAGLKISFYNLLDKMAMRFFDRIILVSNDQRKQLGAAFISPEKISVIPNGIDVSSVEATFARESPRANLGIEPSSFVIGFVGRLSKEKNVGSLLGVFARVKEKLTNVCLLVVGDGPELKALRAKAAKLKISDSVVFTGFRSDSIELLHACDLYLSMSKGEGSPNSVLEAMSLMVPCALSDVRGHNEIISNDQDGLLLSVEETAASEQLIALINDHSRMRRYAEAGRKTVTTKLSLENRIAKLQNLYTGLVST